MNGESQLLQSFLTTEQLAQELGVTTRTLYRWHLQRIGPPRIEVGRTILFSRASVEEWLKSRELKLSRRKAL